MAKGNGKKRQTMVYKILINEQQEPHKLRRHPMNDNGTDCDYDNRNISFVIGDADIL